MVDQRVRAELEVAARPGGDNVRQQHALALAALEVARQGPDPDRPRAVLVVDELMAQLSTSGDKKPLLESQRQLPADGDRTGLAVVRLIAEVHVVLHPLEVGQARTPVPAAGPQLFPTVVVLGLTAERDGGVDRAAAADDLAAGEVEAKRGVVVVPVVVGNPAAQAQVTDVVGNGIAGVRPCLQEEHAQPGILGQPAGHNAAPAARTDDDDVVLLGHISSLLPEPQG